MSAAPDLIGLVGDGLGNWALWNRQDDAMSPAVQYIRAELHAARLAEVEAERTGATATFIPAGPSANAYKYAAKSTRLSMARRATGWYLTEVAEAHVYPKTNDSLRITISQGQASEISRRAISAFTVLAAAE